MKFTRWYDNNHKKILIIPALLIIISLVYLSYFTVQNQDIIYKDVSLTGGTTITFSTNISVSELQTQLSQTYSDVSVSSISDNTGKQLGIVVIIPDTNENAIMNLKTSIQDVVGFQLTDENSSIEFSGSTLSQDFYSQLVKAVIFAFLLMALVVFIVFGENKKIKVYSILLTAATAILTFSVNNSIKIPLVISVITVFFYSLYLSKTKKEYIFSLSLITIFFVFYFLPIYLAIIPLAILLFTIYAVVSVPSIAVILSAFADIVIPLAIIDFFGVKISAAGIVAFLMLIGYSVDTDILLTIRVLKKKNESVNNAIYGAFKTGTSMTLTSMVAISVALIVVYNFHSILNQIFIILIIGLGFDLINTWITNASIIKWYVEKRK